MRRVLSACLIREYIFTTKEEAEEFIKSSPELCRLSDIEAKYQGTAYKWRVLTLAQYNSSRIFRNFTIDD